MAMFTQLQAGNAGTILRIFSLSFFHIKKYLWINSYFFIFNFILKPSCKF